VIASNSKSPSWVTHVKSYNNKSGVNIYIGTFDLASDAALASDKARQYNQCSTPATLNFATIADYDEARSVELTSKGWTNSDVDSTVSSIEAIAKKKMEAYATKITEQKSKKKKGDSLVEEESTQKVIPKYGLLKDGEDHPNPNQTNNSNQLCRVVVDGKVCPTTAKKVISGTGILRKATARAGGIEVCTDHSREKEVIKLAIEFHRKRKAEEEAANPRPKKKANSGGRKKKAEPIEGTRSSTRKTSASTKFEPNHTKRASKSSLVTPTRPASWAPASTTVETPAPEDTLINIPQQHDLEFPELIIELFSNYMLCEKKSNYGLKHRVHLGMDKQSIGIKCLHCQDFKDSGIFLPENMVLKQYIKVENFNKMLDHLSKCEHFSNEEYQRLFDIKDRTIVRGMNQYSEDSTLKCLEVALRNVINIILMNVNELPPMALATEGEALSFKPNTNGEACARGFRTNHERRFNAYENMSNRSGIKFDLTFDKFFRLVKGNCNYCGLSECGSIDRVIAGGDYTDENCVSCCKRCNVDKGCKKLKEFKRRVIKRAKWILTTYLIGNAKAREQFEKYVKDPTYVPNLPVPRKKSISKADKGDVYGIYQGHGKFLLDLHFQQCAFCGDISNGINRRDSTVGYQYPERLEGCCSQDNESLANCDEREFCVLSVKQYNHMFKDMYEDEIDDVISNGEKYMTVMSSEIVGVGSAGWTQRQPIKCTYTRLDRHIELLFPSSYTMGSLGFFKDKKEYILSNFEFIKPKEYNEWATNTTTQELENIRRILGIKTNLSDSIDDIVGE
jgi:hypothetical protein